MPTIEQMKEYLISKYPGPSWKKKVQKMKDGQVYATYRRFKDKEEKEKK